jgi:hypothetical protein
MALDFQQFEVMFRGLAEHSDPKTQLPGALEVCENVVFTKANQVAKRRGFALIPVSSDIEGNPIDPNNVFVNIGRVGGELLLIGYDQAFALGIRGQNFGSGRLVSRGPTTRGNVTVLSIATASISSR